MQRRRGSRGSFRGRCYHSRGQQNMEEMYEVLRFIEHGAHCRQSMDCMRGTLLVRYLKARREIGKSELFGWFRQLCVCVDQYHRCRKQREYRYLNPYSVVVSEERSLFLLDLEACDLYLYRLPFSLSYGVNLPSSLTMLLSLT